MNIPEWCKHVLLLLISVVFIVAMERANAGEVWLCNNLNGYEVALLSYPDKATGFLKSEDLPVLETVYVETVEGKTWLWMNSNDGISEIVINEESWYYQFEEGAEWAHVSIPLSCANLTDEQTNM